MLEEGMILYFAPYKYSNGSLNYESKKRLMLIVGINKNYIKAINITKYEGKENKLVFKSNVLIRNGIPPLKVLSIAKLNDTYIIENFIGIEKYLYNNGEKLNKDEYNKIKEKIYKNTLNNTYKEEMIYISKENILN